MDCPTWLTQVVPLERMNSSEAESPCFEKIRLAEGHSAFQIQNYALRRSQQHWSSKYEFQPLVLSPQYRLWRVAHLAMWCLAYEMKYSTDNFIFKLRTKFRGFWWIIFSVWWILEMISNENKVLVRIHLHIYLKK